MSAFFSPETVLYDLFRNVREKIGRDRHVVKEVFRDVVLPADVAEQVLQISKQLFVVIEIAAGVIGAAAEPLDPFAVGLCSGKLPKVGHDLLAKLVQVHLLAADTDNREILRKMAFSCEVIKGGEQLAFCEIAGCAEDHHHTRVGGLFGSGHIWRKLSTTIINRRSNGPSVNLESQP